MNINIRNVEKEVKSAEITPDHRAQIMRRVKELRTHIAIITAYDCGTPEKVLPLAHKIGSVPEDYSGTSRQHHADVCEELHCEIKALLVKAKIAYDRVRGVFENN